MTRLRKASRSLLVASGAASVLLLHVIAVQGRMPAGPPQAPIVQPGLGDQAEPAHQASAPRLPKRILVLGAAAGFQHDSIPDAMGTIWRMGRESGTWDADLRTDYEAITKKDIGRNARNLNSFDALVLVHSTGEMGLDEGQRRDLLSFVHDDGKGLVGVHAALDANYKWPEFGELLGGWFDEHPWGTFDAPIVVEDPDFPAVRHFPRAFTRRDEIYQARQWSREKVNVLLRLDETRLDYENPRVHRNDRDFAVAWAKLYGKGRVFYSTLGHTRESWNDPAVQTMYFEAVKWALGLTEGSTQPHGKPPG